MTSLSLPTDPRESCKPRYYVPGGLHDYTIGGNRVTNRVSTRFYLFDIIHFTIESCRESCTRENRVHDSIWQVRYTILTCMCTLQLKEF